MCAKLKIAMLCWISFTLFITPEAGAQKAGTPIKVNTVAKGNTPQGMTLYKVDYSYEFKGRDSVFIKGLGSVPAKGQFVYLTQDPKVEFLDSAGGHVIGVAYTLPTYSFLSPIELPSEDAFTKVARDELWECSASFQEMAIKALNKRSLLYQSYERDQVSCLLTTYTSLKELPDFLCAQIALRLTYPYRTKDAKPLFRVQFAARERRIKEDKWRRELCDEVQKVSNKYLDEFVGEVIVTGRGKK